MASVYDTPALVNTPTPIRLIRDEEAPSYEGQPQRERIQLTIIEKDVAVAVCRECGTSAAMYLLLETYADADGSCRPSYDTLADGLGISRRHAIRMVGDLEASGYVEITERKTDQRRNKTNVFTLPFHRKARKVGGDTTSDTSGDTSGDTGSAPVSPKVVRSSREVVESNTPLPPKGEKAPKTPPKDRAVTIPDDFTLTDDLRQYAIDQGINPVRVDVVWEDFRLKSQANGYKKVSWRAFWQTWVRSSYQDRDRVSLNGSNGAVDWNDPIAREAHRKQAEADMLRRL